MARNISEDVFQGRRRDAQLESDECSYWPPSEQELAFGDHFMEMQGLMSAVYDSMGRLEMLGSTLQKCSSLPTASSHNAQQGPAYMPNMHAESDGNGHAEDGYLDDMIMASLQNLHPSELARLNRPGRQGATVDGLLQTRVEDSGESNRFGLDLLRCATAEHQPAPCDYEYDLQARLQYEDNNSDNRGYNNRRSEQKPLPQSMHSAPSAPGMMNSHSSHWASAQPQAMPAASMDSEIEHNSGDACGGFPSIGSAGHFDNTCKPCVFLYNGMCLKASACQFCHMEHDAECVKRVRPSKRTRNLLRQNRDGGDDVQQKEPQPGPALFQ